MKIAPQVAVDIACLFPVVQTGIGLGGVALHTIGAIGDSITGRKALTDHRAYIALNLCRAMPVVGSYYSYVRLVYRLIVGDEEFAHY